MTTGQISPQHLVFVAEYLKQPPTQRDPAAAYGRAYDLPPRGRSATTGGARLLRRGDVLAEIARQEATAAERAGITSEEVVREITLIAKADPRGLVAVHRGACRYCYGVNFEYQRTPREYRELLAAYLQMHGNSDPHSIKLDPEGGVGFNPKKTPHADCPECFGDGEVYEVIKDSRNWTPGAARLYAGLERTKDGLKIKTRSQDRALNLAAQLHHLLKPTETDPQDNIPPPSEVVYQEQDASKKAGG